MSQLTRRALLSSTVGGLLVIPAAAWAGTQRKEMLLSFGALKQQESLIEGIAVPATFSIALEGATEAQAFGPLPAVIELLPPPPQDPNPLQISLYMAAQSEAELVNGSIFWQSFSPDLPNRNSHFSQVTVANGQGQMQVNPSDDSFRSDVMWFTEITGTLAELLEGNTRSAAVPNAGTLTFTIADNQISGELQLTGTTDLGAASTYQARFSGQQQEIP